MTTPHAPSLSPSQHTYLKATPAATTEASTAFFYLGKVLVGSLEVHVDLVQTPLHVV